MYLSLTTTHTSFDVDAGLSLVEGEDRWPALPAQLQIQLFKLLGDVIVVKVVPLKVLVFVEHSPTDAHTP